MTKYTEIFKLRKMLNDAKIPFEFKNESLDFGPTNDFYHIYYPAQGRDIVVCSVVQGFGTYGSTDNKLEIMGLLTDEERLGDSVVGSLTAEDVFSRINKHRAEAKKAEKETPKGFELGQMIATKAVSDRINAEPEFNAFVQDSMRRYISTDWGDLHDEDKQSNNEAVKNGDRILAAYIYPKTGEKIWIITEWDRSATTILYPFEY